MTVLGFDFIAVQVSDVQRAATFDDQLGLRRAPSSPPGAVVFDIGAVSFAVREPLPGVQLDTARPRPGYGVTLWMGADDVQRLHDRLVADVVSIAAPLTNGPFGPMFTFLDPDAYAVTVHDATLVDQP